jgi:AraC family transcriptional regulator, regulatory protein of adaptative response / methylated-DNA-[protein]-cysteine methyltransferase
MSQSDYARVEQAIRFLEQRFQEQPSLEAVAGALGLSPAHFQRLFRRWAGISPKRFVQYLTAEYAKQLLASSKSVLDVAYEAGLSGPGRLHDLFVGVEAMTPGEWKQQGAGLTIRYGVHPTPFGEALLALTERGICGLAFLSEEDASAALAPLRRRWPSALFREEPAATKTVSETIFGGTGGMVTLLVGGTGFQLKVWEALLRIPPGKAVSYLDVAKRIGSPAAVRAVGQAVGQNSIAYLIPCHRVLREAGQIGGYRWGIARKKALLAWEAAQQEPDYSPASSASA